MNDKEREQGATFWAAVAIATWCAAVIFAFCDPMKSFAFLGCLFPVLYVLKHA